MSAMAKQVISRDVRAKRGNRATRRVTASPSILERPLNPVSLELVRFRKRLFMTKAAFAARIGMRLADLRKLEADNIWDDAGKSLMSRMSAIAELGLQFSASTTALECSIKVWLSSGAHFKVLDIVHESHRDNFSLLDIFQLRRVIEADAICALLVRSEAALLGVLHELRAWGCLTFEERISAWTGKRGPCHIQLTTEGQQLAANHDAWREGNLRPNRTRQARCGKKAA